MRKVLLALVLSFSTFLAFGITPVFAETYYPELWQYDSFNLFEKIGGVWSIPDENKTISTSGSEYGTLSFSENISINQADLYQIRCVGAEYQPDYQMCYAYTQSGAQIQFYKHNQVGSGQIWGTRYVNTQSVYIDKFNLFMPIMNTSNVLYGTYTFKWEGKHFYLPANKYYVSFISMDTDKNGRQHNAKLYGSTGIIYPSTHTEILTVGGGVHITLEFNVLQGDNFNFVFDNQINNLIPLYFGNAENISDDIAVLIGKKSTTNTLLENITNGNSQSQQIISSSNSTNQQYESINTQIDNLESQVNADFNSRIDNIPTSSSLLSLPKLVASANWVRERFNELNIAPFSIMLEFSLILGIALIFLGKIR